MARGTADQFFDPWPSIDIGCVELKLSTHVQLPHDQTCFQFVLFLNVFINSVQLAIGRGRTQACSANTHGTGTY